MKLIFRESAVIGGFWPGSMVRNLGAVLLVALLSMWSGLPVHSADPMLDEGSAGTSTKLSEPEKTPKRKPKHKAKPEENGDESEARGKGSSQARRGVVYLSRLTGTSKFCEGERASLQKMKDGLQTEIDTDTAEIRRLNTQIQATPEGDARAFLEKTKKERLIALAAKLQRYKATLNGAEASAFGGLRHRIDAAARKIAAQESLEYLLVDGVQVKIPEGDYVDITQKVVDALDRQK